MTIDGLNVVLGSGFYPTRRPSGRTSGRSTHPNRAVDYAYDSMRLAPNAAEGPEVGVPAGIEIAILVPSRGRA